MSAARSALAATKFNAPTQDRGATVRAVARMPPNQTAPAINMLAHSYGPSYLIPR